MVVGGYGWAVRGGRSLPFRVVVVDPERGATTALVRLDRAPDVGSELVLPHGEPVRVRSVVTADHPDIAAIVVAMALDDH